MHGRLQRRLLLTNAAGGAVALLSLCCVLGPAGRGETASWPENGSAPPARGAHFAIADFDGDRKPDLATVEVEGTNSASRLRYSIHFQLTAGGVQFIGVTAPAGGLQIVARDVNGDQKLDLLVSTEWLHEPVAILLNDGHGKFVLFEPDAFQGVRWDSESSWNSAGMEIKEGAAAMVPRNFSKDVALSQGFRPPGQSKGASVSALARGFLFSEVRAVFGRAPPIFVVQV